MEGIFERISQGSGGGGEWGRECGGLLSEIILKAVEDRVLSLPTNEEPEALFSSLPAPTGVLAPGSSVPTRRAISGSPLQLPPLGLSWGSFPGVPPGG